MNKEDKILFLSLIRDKKEILFGRFSNGLTPEMKMSEWKNILSCLKSQGILLNKDWKYLRDVAWQNLKRATVLKLDNSRIIGSEGGRNSIMTDLDNIIIDIIGNHSPPLNGTVDDTRSITPENFPPPQSPIVDRKIRRASVVTQKKARSKRKIVAKPEDLEMILLRKKKLQLEIYNLQLDARKKETEQNLPRNNLTDILEGSCYLKTEITDQHFEQFETIR